MPVVERKKLTMLRSYYYHNRTEEEYDSIYVMLLPFLEKKGLHQKTKIEVDDEVKGLLDDLWPKIKKYYNLKEVELNRKKVKRKR